MPLVIPFVPSAVDLGRARGPRLAFVVHMAEGGGTVGYLSRPNPNGVSVHYVIERTGQIVRMLDLERMHTSIRSSAIRTGDDADGFFGATAARAVMGDWADVRKSLGPNQASIAVECEGFARDGPSVIQSMSLARLFADVQARFPGIRALGHRDFASYKNCPGRLIRWQDIGGHAFAPAPPDTGTDGVTTVTIEKWPAARRFTATGPAKLRRFDATKELMSVITPYSATADANVAIAGNPGAPTGLGFLRIASGGSAGKYIIASQVTLDPAPPGDCAAAIAEDRTRARIVWGPV